METCVPFSFIRIHFCMVYVKYDNPRKTYDFIVLFPCATYLIHAWHKIFRTISKQKDENHAQNVGFPVRVINEIENGALFECSSSFSDTVFNVLLIKCKTKDTWYFFRRQKCISIHIECIFFFFDAINSTSAWIT